MKFLIQEGKYLTDFQLALIESKEFWKWKGEDFEIYWSNDVPSYMNDLKSLCPVGSVEFCTNWYRNHHGISLKPLNVPNALVDFSTVTQNIIIKDQLSELVYSKYVEGQRLFVKCNNTIKSPNNGVYVWAEKGINGIPSIKDLPMGNYQLREFIEEFSSEWRIFIYDGEVIDVRKYIGDPYECPPSKDYVEGLIKKWIEFKDLTEFPIACTIDIAIYKENEEIKYTILECHDFFACGLYGFKDIEVYPKMLYNWFKNRTKWDF